MSKPPRLHNRTHLRSHFIYYNLHTGLWSLKAEQSVNPHDGLFAPSVKGRVTGHADTILAIHNRTKISEAGRQRVIREKRKNVHAGVVCTTCVAEPDTNFITTSLTQTMSYNPYKRADFYDRETGRTVTAPPYVIMRSGGNDNPPRVYYGNQLYYAFWDDDPDLEHTAGFISSVELLSWIGITHFSGRITCNGVTKYTCVDGHLFYADPADGNDGNGDPEYVRLLDALRYDGSAMATRTISKIVGKQFAQK